MMDTDPLQHETQGVTDTPILFAYNSSKSRVYITFKHPALLHFIGCIRFKVIYGSVKVHGTIFNPDRKFHNLYSTSTHPTYITSCPNKVNTTLEEFLFSSRVNSQPGLPVKDAEAIICKLSEDDTEDLYECLCVVKSISTPVAYYTEKRFKKLFLVADARPILPFFYPLKTAKSLLTPEKTQEWEPLMEQISLSFSPKVMVVGPKGSGKSSYSLYLINYLLNTHRHVLFVECDPGQPEFIPIGNLGVQALKKGKIGPAYTHKVISEVNYFYGSTTPSSNPSLYIEIITKIWKQIQKLDLKANNVPIIINTCGWVLGLGINFMSDLIYIFNPHILVAHHVKDQCNWLNKLTNTCINTNRMFTTSLDDNSSYTTTVIDQEQSLVNLSDDTCFLLKFVSFLTKNVPPVKPTTLLPSDLRALNLISYFTQGLKVRSHFKHLEDILFRMPLYQVNISSCFYQKITVEFSSNDLLDVINANVIALGIAKNKRSVLHERVTILGEEIQFMDQNEMYRCVGLAFVRFIDEKRKNLFITTPVKTNLLTQVNLIMVGTNSLAQSFLPLRQLRNSSFYSMRVGDSLNKGSKFRKANKQLKSRKTNQDSSLLRY